MIKKSIFSITHFSFNLDEDKWKTEAKTEEGAVQEYTISYQNLVPESTYLFRVIAYNKYSISYPAESQDEVNIKKKTFMSNVFVQKKLKDF